jgi:hypothetical protein
MEDGRYRLLVEAVTDLYRGRPKDRASGKGIGGRSANGQVRERRLARP